MPLRQRRAGRPGLRGQHPVCPGRCQPRPRPHGLRQQPAAARQRGSGVGEPHRSRSDGAREHLGQPPVHLRLSRPEAARSPLHGWRGDLAGRSRALQRGARQRLGRVRPGVGAAVDVVAGDGRPLRPVAQLGVPAGALSHNEPHVIVQRAQAPGARRRRRGEHLVPRRIRAAARRDRDGQGQQHRTLPLPRRAAQDNFHYYISDRAEL